MPKFEWYRAWRHGELEKERRLEIDPRFRRREAIKLVFQEAMLLAAIVAFVWASMPRLSG